MLAIALTPVRFGGAVSHHPKFLLTLTLVSRAARGTTARLEALPAAAMEEEARMVMVAEAIVSKRVAVDVQVR
jgi:hypothetical protein